MPALADLRRRRDTGGGHAGPRRAGAGLSPSAEARLIARSAAGDTAARDELVGAFLPSIAGIARRYRGSRGVSAPELMQEGVVGLLRALERYESARGTPFWAYASWWVRQAMQELVSSLGRPVVLSDRAMRQLARVKDEHRRYLQEHGVEPTTAKLAALSALPPSQLAMLLAVDHAPRGLSEPIGGDGRSAGTLGDLVSDPRAEDEYDAVLRRLEIEELRGLARRLSVRERAILRARYGVGCDEHTLQEIAGGLGLSAERVRQIEQRALDKLRAAAGGGVLDVDGARALAAVTRHAAPPVVRAAAAAA